MSSATKVLELLSHFSTVHPELGLSELCKITRRDKATVHRHLQTLKDAGFVEQNPITTRYRLGPTLMRLAQLREKTVPRKDAATAALRKLANSTGETAHVTILSGSTLHSLAACESPEHTIRAILDLSTLPLHATASGICALTFGHYSLFDVACRNLFAFTPTTPTSPDEIAPLIEAARATGFAHADNSLENGIHSLATPIYDETQSLAGTVSVACVATRFTAELEQTIKAGLIAASREISHQWGGTLPGALEAAWNQNPSNPDILRAA